MPKPNLIDATIDVSEPQPPRSVIPRDPNDFKLSEANRLDFFVRLKSHERLSDLHIPEYWAKCAENRLKAHGRPLVHSKIMAFSPIENAYAEYLVLDHTNDGFVLFELNRWDLPLDVTEEGLPPNMHIAYLGPTRRWCVQRNGQLLKKGFDRRDDATTWAKVEAGSH